MLAEKAADKGVVITHPHPLYGGNMDHPVVNETAAAFAQKDLPPCGLISGVPAAAPACMTMAGVNKRT